MEWLFWVSTVEIIYVVLISLLGNNRLIFMTYMYIIRSQIKNLITLPKFVINRKFNFLSWDLEFILLMRQHLLITHSHEITKYIMSREMNSISKFKEFSSEHPLYDEWKHFVHFQLNKKINFSKEKNPSANFDMKFICLFEKIKLQ